MTDISTLAVINNRGTLTDGKQIAVEGVFDLELPERFVITVDGHKLGEVLQAVLSFVRDSEQGKSFVPYLEVWRQTRPTAGTLERSNIVFSKIKRFRFIVELET